MFTPSLCSFPVESTHASFPSRPNNRFSFDHRNRVDCSRFDQFALLSIRTSPGVITIIGIVFSNPSDQSGRRDLNPQHLAWKASALPLSYSRIDTPPHRLILTSILQRLAGSLGCITWYLLHPEILRQPSVKSFENHRDSWSGINLDHRTFRYQDFAVPIMVTLAKRLGREGFEPPNSEEARFTVWCN